MSEGKREGQEATETERRAAEYQRERVRLCNEYDLVPAEDYRNMARFDQETIDRLVAEVKRLEAQDR